MGRGIWLLLAIAVLVGCITGKPAGSLGQRFEEVIPEGWYLAFSKESGEMPYGWTGHGGCAYFRLENREAAYSEIWFCPPGWRVYRDDLVPWPISSKKVYSTDEYDIYYYSIKDNQELLGNLNSTFT